MMVMMIAITPSLNASSLPFPMPECSRFASFDAGVVLWGVVYGFSPSVARSPRTRPSRDATRYTHPYLADGGGAESHGVNSVGSPRAAARPCHVRDRPRRSPTLHRHRLRLGRRPRRTGVRCLTHRERQY